MKSLAGNDVTIHTWSSLCEFMHAYEFVHSAFSTSIVSLLVTVQIESMAEAATTTSSPNAEDTPRITRGRKRVKHVLEWTRTKRTKLRNTGQEYTTKKGDKVGS